MLQATGLPREGHDLANEQKQKLLIIRGMQIETSVRITLHWSGWPSPNLCHSDSTDSSNPRTQYTFPFLCVIFNFLHQSLIVFVIQFFSCPYVGLLFLM